MLRVVCCYVLGQLRDETRDALHDCFEESIFTSGRATLLEGEIPADDDKAYGRILAREWKAAYIAYDSLAIVEPDIVIRSDVVDAFLDCECEYGGFPYSWGPEVGVALGCTRFSAAFIERYPKLMERAVASAVSWRQFDVVVQRHLLVREFGEQPHICGPTVEHLNPLKQLRPGADPTPIATLPAW